MASKIRGAVSSVTFDDFHKNSAMIIQVIQLLYRFAVCPLVRASVCQKKRRGREGKRERGRERLESKKKGNKRL